MFINLIKKIKGNRGNSLAEFAVTTAMMATLATTAAPKFGSVGDGAKEKKTMNNIDKILKVNNTITKVSVEGKGRFLVNLSTTQKSVDMTYHQIKLLM